MNIIDVRASGEVGYRYDGTDNYIFFRNDQLWLHKEKNRADIALADAEDIQNLIKAIEMAYARR